MTQPRLAITLGDPRGIGAEIVRKALADPRVAGACRWVVVGPSGLECAATDVIGEWHPRQSDANAGRLAGKAIVRAVALCQAGDADGVVTAPIDKHALLAGGYDAIADANGHVYGKRKITATSQVKGWLFDGKGPAKLRNLPVAISNGITTGDRFGLYSMVAQLHWPLERGDKGGASLAAREIVRDVDKLMGFGRA